MSVDSASLPASRGGRTVRRVASIARRAICNGRRRAPVPRCVPSVERQAPSAERRAPSAEYRLSIRFDSAQRIGRCVSCVARCASMRGGRRLRARPLAQSVARAYAADSHAIRPYRELSVFRVSLAGIVRFACFGHSARFVCLACFASSAATRVRGGSRSSAARRFPFGSNVAAPAACGFDSAATRAFARPRLLSCRASICIDAAQRSSPPSKLPAALIR